MVLTQSQKSELHKAIYEYLLKNQFQQTAAAMTQEVGKEIQQIDATQLTDVLEKKWTSVLRL
jgi:LisH